MTGLTLAEQMKATALIFCALAFSFGASCSRDAAVTALPTATQTDPHTVWLASGSIISNRLAAAQQLLSVGMNTYDVDVLLGTPSQRRVRDPGRYSSVSPYE